MEMIYYPDGSMAFEEGEGIDEVIITEIGLSGETIRSYVRQLPWSPDELSKDAAGFYLAIEGRHADNLAVMPSLLESMN